MSIHAIHQYLKEVEDVIHYGGTRKETAIRNTFHRLLNDYGMVKFLLQPAPILNKKIKG